MNPLDLRSRTPEGCISELVFDEWSAGELTAERVASLEAHVSECERCRTKKRDLDGAARAYLEANPRLQRQKASVVRPPLRAASARGVLLAAAATFAAAAVLVLSLRTSTVEPSIRTKGGAALGFFVKHGDRVRPGANGEVVEPGDRLRFTVTTTRPRRVAVFSLDPRGVASIYFARENENPVLGERVPLETSVELDDSLGTETLYGLFCDVLPPLEPLRQGLELRKTLSVPPGCDLDVLHIDKTE